MVVVDEAGDVRLMNKEAERILATGRRSERRGGMLRGACGRSRTRSCTKFIAEAFEEEIPDEIVSFPRVSGGRPFLVLMPSQRSSRGGQSGERWCLLLIDTEQRTKVSGDTLGPALQSHPSPRRGSR